MITNYDAKYSALTIAKYVLRKCTLQNKPLTNIKLQKMLFMIQKEYLKYPKIKDIKKGSGNESNKTRLLRRV